MIAFIVKSTVALCVFLAFYHLILEREKMHQFNRFFLLFAIVISVAIPFISFEIIKEIPVDFSRQVAISQHALNTSIHQTAEKVDYKFILLWTLYAIVMLLMAVRFGRNIWKIFSRIGNSPNVEFKNSKLVLVKEKIVPHTFLHYIFINLEDYKKQNIEAELYTHELVHVHQKHTLDILFIEFLKVVFWFNPIFLFYKKAIQLNHEFLADQEIVKTYNNVPFYQNLLLTKGSEKQTIYLASNLNYLVTKKRLIMMKKEHQKTQRF
ncbi:M56 family metallopeptidase [Flavobacterium ginsengisoli]|uniref:M56 family metallopeptidase n=1 Tax=Flavobacterium ginsengisoli TaxID=871694 RepID=UPI00241593F6|nr:M56 family metallopeptidase [Flavobacterium ginsengisoli]